MTPNTAALIPSKISPDPKENLTHFRHSARSESADGSSTVAQEPVCTAGYGLKKKKIFMQAVSPYKHTRVAAPELTVITDDSITQWESAPLKRDGTQG